MSINARTPVVCSQLPSWYRWMNEFSLIDREQVIELFGFSDSSEVDVAIRNGFPKPLEDGRWCKGTIDHEYWRRYNLMYRRAS